MSIEARKQYLMAIIERYKKASRKQKTLILSEFCQVCGYNRKYAILLLNLVKPLQALKAKPGRPSKYDADFIKCLVQVWEATGRICSKKLVAAIPLWLEFFDFPEAQKNLLLQISSSSIDRCLKGYRSQKGICSTRPSLF